jgi:hypothetical protein
VLNLSHRLFLLPLGRLLLLALLLCAQAGTAQAQGTVFIGTPPPPVPDLVAPIWMRPGLAQAKQLKASLQFAYLADNRSAESLRERREYDPLGRLVSVYRFADDGRVAEKVECSYHGEGQQSATIAAERYDAQMEVVQTTLHQYDPAGRLLKYASESDEKGFTALSNTYDIKGRLLLTQHYEADRLPGRSERYTYDDQGRLLEKTEYDLAGELARTIRYTYAPQGHLQEAQVLEQGKALRFAFQYSYDEAGRLLKMLRVGREGQPYEEETYKYNAKGQRIQSSARAPGETKPMLSSYSYDEHGREKEIKVLDTDGSLFQWHRYRYDSTGAGAGFEHLDAAGKTTMFQLQKYDREGRILTSHMFYQDGSGDEQVIYRYDDRGTILDEKHLQFGQESSVYWYVHEYY